VDRSLRLWRTIRWLRPSQVLGRAWFKVHRPSPDTAPAPAVRVVDRRWRNCARRPSITPDGAFRFLGEEHHVACGGDWNDRSRPALWLYNAHYFDDLVADGASTRADLHRRMVSRWIEENPPGTGVGWDPYPTSLRIANWVKWAWAGASVPDAAVHSLALQARWLRKRLEWHLLGNHLWANAKALVFAGAFFEGPEAREWLDRGLGLVDRQLDEQVLADGGHYERSPMYHAIVLEDVLDLLQLAAHAPGLVGAGRIERWSAVAAAMQKWLWAMTHPDGGIAFFNDAALGIAPGAADLDAYGRVLGLSPPPPSAAGLQPLAGTGYVRLQSGRAVVIADVAEVGPDHQPGHAHADTLSFEMSLDGNRVLVNGGISLYQPGPERVRQRGTAAHTTLEIDGLDSSEVWSSFRVGRRARPRNVHWQDTGDAFVLRAAHDGYAFLPGRPLHHREFLLMPGRLVVRDRVTAPVKRSVVRFHLHPGWGVHVAGNGGGWLQGRGRISWTTNGACTATVEASTWHPEFGRATPTHTLVLVMHDDRLETSFCWE
jgi:uncharacterized heparinase superfamily protein